MIEACLVPLLSVTVGNLEKSPVFHSDGGMMNWRVT
jgi:hypothetical protein